MKRFVAWFTSLFRREVEPFTPDADPFIQHMHAVKRESRERMKARRNATIADMMADVVSANRRDHDDRALD